MDRISGRPKSGRPPARRAGTFHERSGASVLRPRALTGKQRFASHPFLIIVMEVSSSRCTWNAADERSSSAWKEEHLNLFTNANAEFTDWVVKAGFLREPFVLVDVGVQGGESPSWHRLGDYLVVHGFDAIEEAIDQPRNRTGHVPNRHYHRIAAGNADEKREFHFNPANPTASSMYAQGTSRFEVPAGEQARSVTVRRLDTLFAEGRIPQLDFLKVDVEGFEKDVLLGANNLLANALAVETETNFGISNVYPKSHFGTLAEILLKHHLLVFDLAFNRIPRASFRRALESKGIKTDPRHGSFGKPAMLNVLFCRDLIDETDVPSKYHTPCKPFTLD